MFDLLKKSMYATIGLAVMTQEKVEELGKKIAQEAKLSEAEGRLFIDELLKKSDEARGSMEKLINEKVEVALKKLNFPTRTEMNNLEIRIRNLETQEKR